MRSRINAVELLAPGSALGSLMTVDSVLGCGGTSVVYAATHVYFSTPVAVKVLSVHGPASDDARARLVREARLCSSLRDPRVPKIYYVDQLPDGSPYIVMEKVDGTTLRAAMTRGPLPLSIVYAVGRQLLDVLTVIHAAAIVHRDVKPGNILFERLAHGGVRLRLLDFGFSTSCGPRALHELDSEEAVLGTPSYMAPEQLTGEAVDFRADVYAAGVVLYELIAGRVPHRAALLADLVAAILHEPPPPLAILAHNAPPAVCAVIRTALEKRPEDRFASTAKMALAWDFATGGDVADDLPQGP